MKRLWENSKESAAFSCFSSFLKPSLIAKSQPALGPCGERALEITKKEWCQAKQQVSPVLWADLSIIVHAGQADHRRVCVGGGSLPCTLQNKPLCSETALFIKAGWFPM